jgi:ABC-type antimicrobial peptide transport system permease subunit
MASTAEIYAKKTEAVGVAPAVWLGLVVAIFAVSRWWLGTDTDVSWLITANEKLLDGGRLYIDAMENNPPAAVYIYTLPVWLARLLHLRPELVVDLSVTALAAASLWFAVRQVRKSAALSPLAIPALLPIAVAILGSTVLAVLAGLAASFRALERRPIEVLRAE